MALPVLFSLVARLFRFTKFLPGPKPRLGDIANSFQVDIEIKNLEAFNKQIEDLADFERRYYGLFQDFVFQMHRYLIRLTPLDTGELRGGWTAYLNKYNEDFTKQILDASLYDDWKSSNITEEGRKYHVDFGKIREGMSQSVVEETKDTVILINPVAHGEYLEFGTSKIQGRHFTELARYKAEFWYKTIFNNFLNAFAKEGKLPKVDTNNTNNEVKS